MEKKKRRIITSFIDMQDSLASVVIMSAIKYVDK